MRPSLSSGTTSPTVSDSVQGKEDTSEPSVAGQAQITASNGSDVCGRPTTTSTPDSVGWCGSPSNTQDGALSDDFLMNYYKVVPCKRKYAHDWASCPWAHNGERASRRALEQHPYLPIACHYAKQRMQCPLGDKCTNAHNLFEYWLHPKRLRTELCQFADNCERPVCFFGHSAADLKPLDPSLPPAEACWSAGAAFRGIRSPQQPPQPPQQRQGQGPGHGIAGFAEPTGLMTPQQGYWQGQGQDPGQGYQQQGGQQQWQGQPHHARSNMMGAPRSCSYPGQSSAGVTQGFAEPPGLMTPQQQQQQQQCLQPPPPQQQQQQQQGGPLLVVSPMQGCDAPSTPSPNPAIHSIYTPPQPQQPQQQQQQQLVILQTGQAGSSSGFATVLPAGQNQAAPQMMQVPVLSANGMQGTYAVPPAQAVHAVHVQQAVQAVQPQPVMQCTLPGSSQPSYWVQVQVPDPNTISTGPYEGAGQGLLQVQQPATVIAAAGNTFPAQTTYVLREGYMQQQQQQPNQQQQQPAQGMFVQQLPPPQQPAQGMLMQQPHQQHQQPAQGIFMQGAQQLQVPNPPGLQDISVLGGASAGVMGAGEPMQAVREVQQQQQSSNGSWQSMYAASSQAVGSVLNDLQGIRLS